MTQAMENLSTLLQIHHNDTQSNNVIIFLTQKERAILTAVFVLLFVLGTVGNMIVVYTIIALGTHADVPTNIFILSQAFSDLGTASSIPIFITHMYMWNWELFYLYTTFVWLASLGSLFLLTLNRLISVVDALGYARRMTPCRARALVVANWTVALLAAMWQMLDFVGPGVYPNFGRYYILFLVICVLFCNGYMFRESRIQARKIKRQNRLVTGLQKNLREDFRSVRTLALVGGTFLLSCLPFMLVVFVYGDDKRTVRFQRNAALWGPLMAINTVLDPLIYYLRSSEFRSFYQRLKRLHGQSININSKDKISLFFLFNEKRRVKPSRV